MPDRRKPLAETERLRAAIRNRAWRKALVLCASLTMMVAELDVEVTTKRPRLRASARGLAVVDGARREGTQAELVPLSDVAHETNLDRRTVESRLKKRGCPIQRWGRIALVSHADALTAVRSFERAAG
jgi:hypothetical protein